MSTYINTVNYINHHTTLHTRLHEIEYKNRNYILCYLLIVRSSYTDLGLN